MKKISSLILAVMTAFGFAGWGALSAHATTAYTAQQVAQHNTSSDCWLIVSGQVYDVTNFIPIHPGGTAIVPYCGTDATTIFDSIHGSTGTAASLLPTYLIGVLATALVAPSNVAGTPTQTTVALNWTASTGGVAPITYTILKNGVSVGTTSATMFTNAGLTASTTYTYVIRANDSSIPAGVASSSQVSVTTLAASSTGGGEQENENEMENETEHEHISTSTPSNGNGHSDDGNGNVGTGSHHENEGGSHGSGHGRDD